MNAGKRFGFPLCRPSCGALIILALGSLAHGQRGWDWSEVAKLAASDAAAGDHLGYAVSLSGDTALVGAPRDHAAFGGSGSAYVFVRSGTGWSQQAKLTASDPAVDDEFGTSVAIVGDTALVGAPWDDDAGDASGSAYVFVRTGTTWSQQAKLTAGDARDSSAFGWSVALSGESALVGAYGDRNRGAAYVFVRSGTTWSQQGKLEASDAADFDLFGCSVSLAGDTAAIGAWANEDAGKETGAAYVFARSGTSWVEQAKLLAGDMAEGDKFGTSVSISGDTALVGAPDPYNVLTGHGSGYGAGYVFVRSGTGWAQQAKLTADVAEYMDMFGASVFLDGDRALIGAYGRDDLGPNSGSAHVFARWGLDWHQTQEVLASDGASADWFGVSVSGSGATVLVGAYRDDDGGTDSGSAYVFDGTASAAVTYRNAGTNPASYQAVTLPRLGTTYTGTIDLAGTTGHSFAWLVGFAGPLTLPFAGGQMLLVNIADAGGELLGQVPVAGPVATYGIPIPADGALMGLRGATQALHFGGSPPFALSNALDLFLGN